MVSRLRLTASAATPRVLQTRVDVVHGKAPQGVRWSSGVPTGVVNTNPESVYPGPTASRSAFCRALCASSALSVSTDMTSIRRLRSLLGFPSWMALAG